MTFSILNHPLFKNRYTYENDSPSHPAQYIFQNTKDDSGNEREYVGRFYNSSDKLDHHGTYVPYQGGVKKILCGKQPHGNYTPSRDENQSTFCPKCAEILNKRLFEQSSWKTILLKKLFRKKNYL